MKKVLTFGLLAALSMTALNASAQSFNDRGIAVNPAGFSLNGPYVPSGTGPICPTGPVVSAFTGARTQMGRIFRDGVAGTCPTKPYPGIFNPTTVYNYETYSYSNTSAAPACVTVNFDPNAGGTPCAANAHMSAYLGSYDPANQSANFLNDVGSSATQPFSFQIAANSTLVLAVTNTSVAAVCTFGFEVTNLPCSAATSANLGVTVAASPTSTGPNTPVNFTVTSTNGGPDPAQNVVVSLDLGASFRFNSVSAAGATCTNPAVGASGIVACTFAGATASGAQRVIVVNASAPNAGAAAVIGSTSSMTPDPTPANNTSTAVVQIVAPAVFLPVPTQNTLGLILMGLLLAAIGWLMARRRA